MNDTASDAFTKASATYEAARRIPYKTGPGIENFDPPRRGWPLVAIGLFAMGVCFIALAVASQ